ncbi:oxysterol-binding protein 2-like isoform X1 [Porites lutea]|uniref:oxysterol-binding protein 2-like isoform X1 n=2 Tax=Porites lutea TaxID=51062 RepID=UPI003CC617A1
MIRTQINASELSEKEPLEDDCDTEFLLLKESIVFTKKRPTRKVLPVARERSSIRSLINFMKSVVGKDLTKVTMPVHFNEPLSFLQRLAEDLEYADILNRASFCKNSLMRLAHVAAFASSTYSTVLGRFWKPFNPILGETFEFINHDIGYALIAEQVSHHPPISALHAESDHWVFWQEYKLDTKFRGQFFKVIPTGMCHVKFKSDGHHFSWKKPITTIHNILVGSLYVDQEGDVLVTNHMSREQCALHFQPVRKVQENFKRLTGEVRDRDGHVSYRITGAWDTGLELLSEDDPNMDPIDLWAVNNKPEDSSRFYAFTKFTIQLNDPEYDVSCHTDCRVRTDIRLLECGKIDASASEKHRLEEKQRAARRQRDLSGEAWSPRWFVPKEETDSGTFCYMYKGGYWKARLKGQYTDSPYIY